MVVLVVLMLVLMALSVFIGDVLKMIRKSN